MSDSARILGQTKFFSKKGYGFITALEGGDVGADIFVHHSAIVPNNNTYRHLRRGEIVEFEIVPSPTVAGKRQAANVSGVRGAPMMCDIIHHQHHESVEA